MTTSKKDNASGWFTHRINDEREFTIRTDRITAVEKITTVGALDPETNAFKKEYTINLYLDTGGTIKAGENLTEEQANEIIAELQKKPKT